MLRHDDQHGETRWSSPTPSMKEYFRPQDSNGVKWLQPGLDRIRSNDRRAQEKHWRGRSRFFEAEASHAASLPPRSAWKPLNCCVPLELLLENYNVKVQQGRLQRGMLLHVVWLVVLITFFFATMGGKASALMFTGYQLLASIDASTFVTRSYFRLGSSQESDEFFSAEEISLANLRRMQDSNDDSSTSSECDLIVLLSENELIYNYSQRVRPFETNNFQEYLAYYANILALRACQPNSSSGVCASKSFQKQQRSTVFEGSEASSSSSSCLADPAMSTLAFPDINLVCSSVELAPWSDLFCFPGFQGDIQERSDVLNTLWRTGALSSPLADNITLHETLDSCLAVPFGAQSGCFLDMHEWRSFSLNTALSDDDFAQRIHGINFTLQFQHVTETTVDPRTYKYTWADLNTKSLTTALSIGNVPLTSMAAMRISFQGSLTGAVTASQQVLVYANLKIAKPDGGLTVGGIIMCVIVALVVTYIAVDLFLPLALITCARQGTRSTRLSHYFKYSSLWNLMDLVLLMLYCFLLAHMAQHGLDTSHLYPNNINDGSTCAHESYIIKINRTKQIVGLLLLATFIRLMKYISLVPALNMTWRAIVKGFYYYLPALLILVALWLVFAFANLITLHNHYAQFSNYYEALLSVIIMHVDAGSSAWASLMHPQQLSGMPLDVASDTEVHFFTILWIFEFFVVFPFTALSISAFYHAIVSVTVDHHQKNEQARADFRASRAQAVLTQLYETNNHAMLTSLRAGSGHFHQSQHTLSSPEIQPLNPSTSVPPGTPGQSRYRAEEEEEYSTRLNNILDTYAGEALLSSETLGRHNHAKPKSKGAFHLNYRKTCAALHRNMSKCFLRTKLCFLKSEAAIKATADLRRLQRSHISHKDALYRLQIYAASAENQHSVFISYNEIAAVISTRANGKRSSVTEDLVLGIMDLVGAGNVYYENVRHRHEGRRYYHLVSGGNGNKPSATDIAAAEGRRRRITIAQWQEASSDAVDIRAMTERIHKLEDTSTIALGILTHDVQTIRDQQHRMLSSLMKMRHSLDSISS